MARATIWSTTARFGARPHDGVGEVGRPLAHHPHDFVARSHDDRAGELVDASAEHRIPQSRIEPLQQIARVAHGLTRLDRDLAQREAVLAYAAGRLARGIGTLERDPFEIDPRPFESIAGEL